MSESIRKNAVQPAINAQKSGILNVVQKFGQFLGRKVGLIKTSDLELQKQYIDLGRQADRLVDGIENKNLSHDMEMVREVRFGDGRSLAYAKNFVKILDNTHQMGLMKTKNHEAATKIYDLSVKQSKIAEQLSKRGIQGSQSEDSEAQYEAEEAFNPLRPQINTDRAVQPEDLRAPLFDGLPNLKGIEILSLKGVSVSNDIQKFVDGLLHGYENVTKEEAQNHLRIAGMFIRDKRERQPIAVAKALLNAYKTEDKYEVIDLLNILSEHFPQLGLSALCTIFKSEGDKELKELLEKSIKNLVEEMSTPKQKESFSLFSNDESAMNSQDFGARIAAIKRGSRKWRGQVQEFSDLLKHHHVKRMQNLDFLDLLPIDCRPKEYIAEAGSDVEDLCDFIALAIMQQNSPKKMTKLYHFFSDVMIHLKKQKFEDRIGDAQGVTVIMAALSRGLLSRLVDRDAIQPHEHAKQLLNSEVSLHCSPNSKMKAAARAAENGLSLYVSIERCDNNAVLETDSLRDQIAILAEKKVPGYVSIKNDLKDYQEQGPNLRLQRPVGITEDDLYSLSYQIAGRG